MKNVASLTLLTIAAPISLAFADGPTQPRPLQLRLSDEYLATTLPRAPQGLPEKDEAKENFKNGAIQWDTETKAKIAGILAGGGMIAGGAVLTPGMVLDGTNVVDEAARKAFKFRSQGARDSADKVSTYMLVGGLMVAPALIDGVWVLIMKDQGGRVVAKLALDEAFTLAQDYGIVGMIKLLGRKRPCAEGPNPTCSGKDSDLSAPSQHTATAVSMAFNYCANHVIDKTVSYGNDAVDLAACGTVSAMALTVGYLRMAADKHHLTDVGAGLLIGLGVGWANRKLHFEFGRRSSLVARQSSSSDRPETSNRSETSYQPGRGLQLVGDIRPLTDSGIGISAGGAWDF